MASTPENWRDVQDGLERLALKLDLHLRQATSKERQELEDALQRVGDAVQGALDGMRNASRDPAIRDDLRGVATALGAAVSSTLSDVGDEIRKVMDRGSTATTKADGSDPSTVSP
jgi:signal transduction histidine kinase